MYKLQRCVVALRESDTKLIELQTGLRNAPTPRPNKRPRIEATDENTLIVTPATTKGKQEDVRQSLPSQLDEFMNVMQPRTKKEKTWANDVDSVPPLQPAGTGQPKVTDEPEAVENTAEEGPEALDDLEWLKRRTVAGNAEQNNGDSNTRTDNNARSSVQVRALPN